MLISQRNQAPDSRQTAPHTPWSPESSRSRLPELNYDDPRYLPDLDLVPVRTIDHRMPDWETVS